MKEGVEDTKARYKKKVWTKGWNRWKDLMFR